MRIWPLFILLLLAGQCARLESIDNRVRALEGRVNGIENRIRVLDVRVERR